MKAIRKLFNAADSYTAQATWKDFALIKVCLCSLGIMIGTGVPREGRKPVFIGALAAFLASWAAAMATFAPLLGDSFREED